MIYCVFGFKWASKKKMWFYGEMKGVVSGE